MNNERDKIRKDIQTYENQGKIKTLSRLGTLGSLAAVAHGGFTGNKHTLYGGLASAVGTGYLAGRSSQKRDRALSRIKRHYDLRDRKFFDMKAVLPSEDSIKKTAMLGSLLHGIQGIGEAIMAGGAALPMIGTGLKALGPLALDAAATPGLAKWMTNRGLDYANVFAKHQLGKTLTPQELKMVGSAISAKGSIAAANADKSRFLGPLRRYFTSFVKGPAGMGGEIGSHAGQVLKHVGEISPRYQEMGLNAINNEEARKVLLDTAKKDLATLNKGVDAAKKTRLYSAFSRLSKGSAPSIKQLASDIVENPEKLEGMVNSYKVIEDKSVDAAKKVGIGGLLALTAGFGGSYNSGRHPLSKDELPTKLINS